MTLREKLALLGPAMMAIDMTGGRITFPVEITDVRDRFGTVDVQVTPEGGSGQVWVTHDRITHHDTQEGTA